MKRCALLLVVACSLAATQSAAQSVEEQLRNLKRLRDAGLISEPVYVEQQRRILEMPAPKADAAPRAPAAPRVPAAPGAEAAPAAAAAGLPHAPAVGATWSYRFQDRLFPARQQAFVVRVEGLSGAQIQEVVQGAAGERSAAPVDLQAVRFLDRDIGGGQRLVEISPYLLSAAVNNALPNPPTHYPLGGSNEPFRVRVASMLPDQVSVPAGSFKAVRVEVSGERSTNGFAGLSGGLMNSLAVTRFRYTAWYSTEVRRYVMLRHQQWNPGGAPVADEVVQLMSHKTN
jgi:hypothetical protein